MDRKTDWQMDKFRGEESFRAYENLEIVTFLTVLPARATPELLAQTILPALALKYLGPKTPSTDLGRLFYRQQRSCVWLVLCDIWCTFMF